ncbi:MAG: hypothetical protein KBD50_00885 [Candidatus Pacebacteria bacterium]|nr:hypothetical protein [Candidatus Paceibacterota bacterium]
MRLFPDKYEGEYEVLLPEPLPKPKVPVPTRPDVQPRVAVAHVTPTAEPFLVTESLAEDVVVPQISTELAATVPIEQSAESPVASVPSQLLDDAQRRVFLKGVAVLVVGAFATTLFPRRADALVMGSTPGTSVVGLKDASNARINPATEEGTAVLKKTTNLSSSGTVHTPASGKKVRVYNTRFSLDANLSSVSFRFTAGGTDYEKYLSPRLGGLYGTKNHPNYFEGGVDEVVYCVISGTGNVQVNIDYLEV